MRLKLAFAVALLLLCSACTTHGSVSTASPSPIPVSTDVLIPPSSSASEPIEFPKNNTFTYSYFFGITGMDGLLYDSLCYLYKDSYGGPYDLILFALSVLDDATYVDSDGNTNYVCLVWQFDYTNLGLGLADRENPQYSISKGASNFLPIRFVISPPEIGVWCNRIVEMGDGGVPEERFADVLGPPNADLIPLFMDKTYYQDILESARPITPTTPAEMLSLYLDCYFKD